MYIWQWNFLINNEHYTIYGRTWKEFRDFSLKISNTVASNKLVIFIHNASYEFQFISGIYNFKVEDVFAVKSRKVLKFKMLDNLEFRCSYLLTNMSLDLFTKKMKVSHKKLSGFDYKKERYAWTELSKEELDYCIHDVVGLCEAIKIQNEINNDTLASMPLTSTGYVRRDLKSHMYICKKSIEKICPTYAIYQMEREAFVGGDTHANRYYVGQEIENVKCADIVSDYPAQIMVKKFPMSKFKNQGECTIEYLEKMISKDKACLIRIHFENLRLQDRFFGCPYIHKDKCRHLKNGIIDNGRVLEADSLDTTITDIDYDIIKNEYQWDSATIYELATAKYGYLPKQCKDTIMQYYYDKTSLKGVMGQEIFYDKSKNLLNAIYGMFAQNPVKQSIDYINGEFVERNEDESKLLDVYNSKTVVAYQWGLWVTAHARHLLHEMIWYVGTDNFVYCDTDSVYFVGDVDIDGFNKNLIEKSIYNGAYAKDLQGKMHYMGTFEIDKCCTKFKTWGAKRYVYVNQKDNKLHVTVAGVSKKKDENGNEISAQELIKHGGISAFKDGFVFNEAGGTEIVYNDIEPHEIIKDGHKLIITRNAVIRDTTYTVLINSTYMDIINNAAEAISQLEKERGW